MLNELYEGSKSTFNWFAGLTVGAMGWKSHPLAQEVNQDLNNVVNFVTSIPDMSKEELGSASAKLTSSAMSAAATWAFFKSFRAPASGRNNLVPSQKAAQSPVVQSVDDAVSSANSAGKTGASFGNSTSTNYRATFFSTYPELEGQVVVHHAVEQQVLTRYPGVVNLSEMHSLENLRGIPNAVNNDIHLSQIRRAWNQFYRTTPSPTKEQLLDKATEIDNMFGTQFLPKR